MKIEKLIINNFSFLDLIIDSLMLSDNYFDETDRLFDIAMLRLLFMKLDIDTFMDNYDLSKSDYEQYFKEILATTDFFSKKELENEFKNLELQEREDV
jgi:hypothetical protein